MSAIRSELHSLYNRCNHHSLNLSRSEFLPLSRLRSHTGIRILAADKNLGPTIVTDAWYRREVSRLLSDKTFYKEVEVVPFVSIKNKLISILERYGNTIGDRLISCILQYVEFHTPAHFKLLPKVHKCPMVGRPIVLGDKEN